MDADQTSIAPPDAAPPDAAPRKPVAELLADAGLRPTRQRLALGELLFGDGGAAL
jgi:Fur family iron response transcriptional regulator